MARLRDRPTADLIVMLLAGVVAFCVLGLAIVVLISSIWFPDHDVLALTQRMGTILSSLVAALVGYLAGRGVSEPASRVER